MRALVRVASVIFFALLVSAGGAWGHGEQGQVSVGQKAMSLTKPTDAPSLEGGVKASAAMAAPNGSKPTMKSRLRGGTTPQGPAWIIFHVTNENEEPLEKATVEIGGKTATTDSRGQATVDGLNEQEYDYTITKDGYKPYVDFVTGNKITLDAGKNDK